MPFYLAICVAKAHIKLIPDISTLAPYLNAKEFSLSNPGMILINIYEYFNPDDLINIIEIEAKSKDVAWIVIMEEYPHLFIWKLTLKN